MANKTKTVTTIETHKVIVIRRISCEDEKVYDATVKDEIARLSESVAAADTELDPDPQMTDQLAARS